MDDLELARDRENRHLGQTYVPKRGRSTSKYTDAHRSSSMGGIMIQNNLNDALYSEKKAR